MTDSDREKAVEALDRLGRWLAQAAGECGVLARVVAETDGAAPVHPSPKIVHGDGWPAAVRSARARGLGAEPVRRRRPALSGEGPDLDVTGMTFCRACMGSGHQALNDEPPCPRCSGTGWIPVGSPTWAETGVQGGDGDPAEAVEAIIV